MPRIPRLRRDDENDEPEGARHEEARTEAEQTDLPGDGGGGGDAGGGGDESTRERFVLDRQGNARPETEEEEQQRVSVVHEPLPDGHEDEYKWHTGRQRPHGA